MAWFAKTESSQEGNGHGAAAAAVAAPPENAAEPAIPEWYVALKRQLHQQVIGAIDLASIGTLGEEQLRMEVRRKAEAICQKNANLLNLNERERLINEVLDEAFGLGPLEPLFRDPTVSDILINGPKTVFIERRGRLEKSNIAFHDSRHLLQIVQRIAAKVGRRVDETSPMVDARLPDGSRLNAIIAPLALEGPLVSIRRFGARPLHVEDLITNGSITSEMVQFLEAAVEARINIIISGGTGSGKTTLLNALSRYIPSDERVATIEDAAELQLQQAHVVKMETRPANVEGHGEVTTRELVRNALRMRPDRIIVGECRGPESLDMLQAMNTGHEGSLTTIHANNPRDAISRLEMMVGMAGFELPIWVIRKQIASAINLVVQASRLMGGPRKITRISEITGMEGDVISMHDIFEFVQTGLDEKRTAVGYFRATGMRPECLAKLEMCGVGVPPEMFERRKLETATPRKG
ncbi:MAG TPA: CpaF family protein [Pirellulaceae bacterium]|nr:CpaF family protein [Pirellulaceae bacterium]